MQERTIYHVSIIAQSGERFERFFLFQPKHDDLIEAVRKPIAKAKGHDVVLVNFAAHYRRILEIVQAAGVVTVGTTAVTVAGTHVGTIHVSTVSALDKRRRK